MNPSHIAGSDAIAQLTHSSSSVQTRRADEIAIEHRVPAEAAQARVGSGVMKTLVNLFRCRVPPSARPPSQAGATITLPRSDQQAQSNHAPVFTNVSGRILHPSLRSGIGASSSTAPCGQEPVVDTCKPRSGQGKQNRNVAGGETQSILQQRANKLPVEESVVSPAAAQPFKNAFFIAKQKQLEAKKLELDTLWKDKTQFQGANGMDSPFYLAALNHKYPGLNARLIEHPYDLIMHLHALRQRCEDKPLRERAMLASTRLLHYVACDVYVTSNRISVDIVDSVSIQLFEEMDPWLCMAKNALPGFEGISVDFTALGTLLIRNGCSIFSPHTLKQMWRDQKTRDTAHEKKEAGKINLLEDSGQTFSPVYFKLMQDEKRRIDGDDTVTVTKKPEHKNEKLSQRKKRVFKEFMVGAHGEQSPRRINTSVEKQRIHLYRDIGEFFKHTGSKANPDAEMQKALDFVLPFRQNGWDQSLREIRALITDWDSTRDLNQLPTKDIPNIPKEKQVPILREILQAMPTWRSALLRHQGMEYVKASFQWISWDDLADAALDVLQAYRVLLHEEHRLDSPPFMNILATRFSDLCRHSEIGTSLRFDDIRHAILNTMSQFLDELSALPSSSLQEHVAGLLERNIYLVPKDRLESLLIHCTEVYESILRTASTVADTPSASLLSAVDSLVSSVVHCINRQCPEVFDRLLEDETLPARLREILFAMNAFDSTDLAIQLADTMEVESIEEAQVQQQSETDRDISDSQSLSHLNSEALQDDIDWDHSDYEDELIRTDTL